MKLTKLYITRNQVNSLYLEVYGIATDCFIKFGCPVVFDIIKKKDTLHVRYLLGKNIRYEMAYRYLDLETKALNRVQKVVDEITYEVNVFEFNLNHYSLDEIENSSKFLYNMQTKNLGDYTKKIYN